MKMLYDVDEDFDLYVAPKCAIFSPSKGGASRHLMVNGSSEKIAIKIKCSNNKLYRISPVFTLLEPGRAQRLQVVRDPGEAKVDKLILLYVHTNCRNAREAFANVEKTAVQKRLIKLDARSQSPPPTPTPSANDNQIITTQDSNHIISIENEQRSSIEDDIPHIDSV